jgi:TfoX/Sxy family transcriptional regulator of competence genes
MPFDEKLAGRVRRLLDGRTDVEEKRMFGGLAFMVRGHMSVGLLNSTLMVRVDVADQDELLDEPHARPMDFTGRPMRGFLYVDPPGIASGPALKKWVSRGVAFADSKPAKTRVIKRRPTTRARR